MEEHPEVSLAFSRQEIMNKDGVVIRKSKDWHAQTMAGPQFIRRLWQTFELGFEAVGTFMARSSALIERGRSEEHTSELQSLMRISYAVFCLKKKNQFRY